MQRLAAGRDKDRQAEGEEGRWGGAEGGEENGKTEIEGVVRREKAAGSDKW